MIVELEAKDLISLGALCVAFMALFIAPWVNARNSKRQVIAPMRQAWINALRDKLSEFVSIASIERCHIDDDDLDRERYERLKLLSVSIELHINIKETEHQKLVSLVVSILNKYHNKNDARSDIKRLVFLSQEVLKEEWEVTKKT